MGCPDVASIPIPCGTGNSPLGLVGEWGEQLDGRGAGGIGPVKPRRKARGEAGDKPDDLAPQRPGDGVDTLPVGISAPWVAVEQQPLQ